jgi:hypothetical protein
MFFFIGGIQPRITFVDKQPVLCPSCGLLRARYKRVDIYIPVFYTYYSDKKRDTFLFCERCGLQAHGEKQGIFMGITSLSVKTVAGPLKRILSIVLFAGNHYKGE